MNYFEISNEHLSVSLCDFAGEMTKITKDGKERLWCGNPEFWKYHAPFLFPIVGTLSGGEMIFDGNAYKMKQHGLARIATHEVVEKTNNSITFVAKSNEETLKCYPFEYEFFTKYTLSGSKIEICITVCNLSDSPLFASVGAHPAFPIDLFEGDTLEDYQIEFEKTETNLVQMHIENALVISENDVNEAVKVVKMCEQSLNDTIIYRNFKSDFVSLVHKKSGLSVRTNLKGHPLVGFWKAPGSPFLCLEPWNGVADYFGTTKDFAKKPYIEKIEKTKSYDFSIEIL